ncbi:MAG: hypothetical protein ACRCXT_02365 [Paraclostridium sp.]
MSRKNSFGLGVFSKGYQTYNKFGVDVIIAPNSNNFVTGFGGSMDNKHRPEKSMFKKIIKGIGSKELVPFAKIFIGYGSGNGPITKMLYTEGQAIYQEWLDIDDKAVCIYSDRNGRFGIYFENGMYHYIPQNLL